MSGPSRSISKVELAAVLRRVGVSKARRDEILRQLPDPVDTAQAESVLTPYGITLSQLMNRMGASP